MTSTPASPSRPRRSLSVTDPRDLNSLWAALRGSHGPRAGHEGGAWSFSIVLASFAALYVFWLARDLGEGYQIDWTMVGLLAGCTYLAVTLLFFTLKTNTDRYEFGDTTVQCFDARGRPRWQLTYASVDEIVLVKIRRQRFYLYLASQERDRRVAVHSHESIATALRALPWIREAFGLESRKEVS